jgi:general secretion pathway protein C
MSWVAPLTAVLCALFAARGANHMIEAAWFEEPRPSMSIAVAAPRVTTLSREGRERALELLCSDCEPEAKSEHSRHAPTTLALHCVATNVSVNPIESFASIYNVETGSGGAYGIGDTIPGAGRVLRIAARYVDFENRENGRVERIDLLSESLRFKEDVDILEVNGPLPPRAGIEKRSDTSFSIERSLIDSVLTNPAQIGARVVPSMKNGKPNGYKIYGIRPHSILGDVGFMNGDALQRIECGRMP